MIFWQILEFKIENLPFFWFSRENGLLWHLSRYDIIYSVVAPILATERGCLHVRNHIFSCFRTGKCSWLLHLQMVRRR